MVNAKLRVLVTALIGKCAGQRENGTLVIGGWFVGSMSYSKVATGLLCIERVYVYCTSIAKIILVFFCRF